MSALIEQAIAIFTANDLHFTRRDGNCLFATFEAKQASHEVFVEAFDEFNLFGVYIYPPTKIPHKSLPRIMEYVTRINYGLRMGHFELDLDEGVLRFAHAIDIEASHITPPQLLNAVYFGLSVLDDYYPGLMQIVYTGISPRNAYENIKLSDCQDSLDKMETGASNRPLDRLRH